MDIDLAILGASEQRFPEYESQIKLEYSHLTKAQFLDGRKKILKSFMERQRIYSTDFFFSRLEKQARENLLKSISVLE